MIGNSLPPLFLAYRPKDACLSGLVSKRTTLLNMAGVKGNHNYWRKSLSSHSFYQENADKKIGVLFPKNSTSWTPILTKFIAVLSNAGNTGTAT